MRELTPLDRLIAIEEIKRLKSRRDRAVDLKDWDTYRELHAPDHRSENDGYEPWTRDEMMHHLIETIGHVRIAHLSHTPDIEIHSPDEASGVWYLEDHHFWEQDGAPHWLHGFGFYFEKYVRRDGAWLFHRRRIQRTIMLASPGASHPAKTAAIKTGHFIGEP